MSEKSLQQASFNWNLIIKSYFNYHENPLCIQYLSSAELVPLPPLSSQLVLPVLIFFATAHHRKTRLG